MVVQKSTRDVQEKGYVFSQKSRKIRSLMIILKTEKKTKKS